MHDDGVHRRHHHAFGVVKPLQEVRILGRIDGGNQGAAGVLSADVPDDRARFVEGDVAVFEHRHAAERVTRTMIVRFEIGWVEAHLIELILEVELGEQPDDAEGAAARRVVELEHESLFSIP